MASLSQLKKKRGNNLKKLQEKLEEANGSSGPRDERIWKPKFNQEKGKGTAIVRFLTPKEGDPFVEVKNYSFKGKNGNFYGMARATIKEDDPVQIAAINCFRKAKRDNDERYKDMGKKYLPRSQYFANVYVVKDEENPENEGKVKIFQFGRQIFNIIEKAIKPEFDDEDPMDPFDFWEGAEFKIRMVGKEIPDQNTGKKIKVPNYEDSTFDRQSEFMDGDEEKIQEYFDQTYDLSEFIDPSKVKSFEEVAEFFKKVTGKDYRWLDPDYVEGEYMEEKETDAKLNEEQDNDDGSDQHRDEKEEQQEESPEQESKEGDDEGEEDDILARFRSIANN